jgi:hypothetical protein
MILGACVRVPMGTGSLHDFRRGDHIVHSPDFLLCDRPEGKRLARALPFVNVTS